jgi:hypothetical protein
MRSARSRWGSGASPPPIRPAPREVSIRALPLPLLLLACQPTPKGPGSRAPAHNDTAVSADDSGDTAGDSVEWLSLPNDCGAPTPDGVDPFQLTGAVENTQVGQSWFVEILDLVYLPDEGRVLASGQGGLVVYDVSGGGDPITQGHIAAGPQSFQRYYNVLPIAPGLTWTTHRQVGLDTISVSDPDAPALVSRVEAKGFEGLDRTGDHLYVASTEGFVEVFDVSDPTAPATLSQVVDLGRPWDVRVQGEVAYVADGDLGVVALDLSDPSAPVVAGSAESAGQPIRITGDGASHVYVAAGAGGVEVYDVSAPLAPVRVASVDVGGSAQDVALDDGLLGVTTQEAVVLLDVGRDGTPAAPIPFAYQETEQFAMTLDAAGGTWVVGDWNILGLWQAGTGLAPAIDPSVDIVAFLDGGETRELAVVNRGGAPLDLSGIAVPDGVTALVSATTLAPGERARLALTWDGIAPLDQSPVCIASDDPERPAVSLTLTSGEDGEGRVIGQQAPDFALQDLDGATWRLSDQLGHPVVLAYFATW